MKGKKNLMKKSKEKNEEEIKNLATKGAKPRTRKHPLTSSNPFSKVLGTWLSETLKISKNHPWKQSMHYKLPERDTVNAQTLHISHRLRTDRGLFLAITNVYRVQIIEYIALGITSALIYYLVIYSASKGVSYIQNEEIGDPETLKKTIFCFFVTSLAVVLRNLLVSYYRFKTLRMSLLLRSTLICVIYQKILKTSIFSSMEINEGFVYNMVQVDAAHTSQLFMHIFNLFTDLSTTIVAILYLSSISTFYLIRVLLGAYLLLNLLYIPLFLVLKRATRLLLTWKDWRMTYLRNVLLSLEDIKAQGMENWSCIALFQKRAGEISSLKGIGFIKALISCLGYLSYQGSILLLILYLVFRPTTVRDYSVLVGLISSFSLLRLSAGRIFDHLGALIQLSVSLRRMSLFLLAQEMSTSHITEVRINNSKLAISIKRGRFRWKSLPRYRRIGPRLLRCLGFGRRGRSGRQTTSFSQRSFRSLKAHELLTYQSVSDYNRPLISEEIRAVQSVSSNEDQFAFDYGCKEEEFFLKGIDLNVNKGDVVLITGKNGSGKSGLLYAFLGEMVPVKSNLCFVRDGAVGLVSGNCWMVDGTIFENIVLGRGFDKARMSHVVRVAQLQGVLDRLEGGLRTFVEVKGANFSCGERAKIAIARCFYQK